MLPGIAGTSLFARQWRFGLDPRQGHLFGSRAGGGLGYLEEHGQESATILGIWRETAEIAILPRSESSALEVRLLPDSPRHILGGLVTLHRCLSGA